MKTNTTISIDPELLKQAKERMLNISGLTESAIREKLGKVEIQIPESTKCDFCGNPGEQETRDTINQKKTGLSFLWPDDRWICNTCLKSKSRQVLK